MGLTAVQGGQGPQGGQGLASRLAEAARATSTSSLWSRGLLEPDISP